jgi:SAM-dependent methyltransferase
VAEAFWQSLVAAASEGYRAADAHAHRFARAKLRGDRVFRHVLAHGLIAPGATVLDLGCGQGLLAAVLRAADDAGRAGRWPEEWAPPPTGARVIGIDPLPLDIDRARTALGGAATFVLGDMRTADLPACDTAVFFDTLHYIAHDEQSGVLARVRAALRPGGSVLMRVGDYDAGWRFRLGLRIDQATAFLHGNGMPQVCGRPRAGWTAELERLGFAVSVQQMNGRPPFANLFIQGRLGDGASPQ